MTSMEGRNVETAERWCRDVFEGDLDLLDKVFTYPYVLHSPRGTVSQGPESRRAAVAAAMSNNPGLRWQIDDIVARGDKVACCLTAMQPSTESSELEPTTTWLEIHRLLNGRIAETWVCWRDAAVGPWQGESVPHERWSIAFSETLTPNEEANLATLNRWGDIRHNRSNDFDALPRLVADRLILHGPVQTQALTVPDVLRVAAGFAERYSGFAAKYDDVFVVGDRAAARFCYRFPEPSPERGSLQCGIGVYRFEDHRIAEYWQANLPNDVDWT
ncbi:MAG: nuclear transport factor 2 family protein [SAR202 cluster bacterium]|jgi:predicted SnoaL-like aldol condensation-catalyzing enzyme|nr:nuclear transport factor 2 family protein [SAR202 cluster bacterium]